MQAPPDIQKKKVIIFDLDGTLTETKSPMDAQMAELLRKLLERKTVAVIGGGRYELFKEQLIRRLRGPKKLLRNLFLFPTTATTFYRFTQGWNKIYDHQLTKKEKRKIFKAFQETFKEVGYVHPRRTYGKVIEDRGTQVTFSALGQDVVKALGRRGVELKKKWKDENAAMKMRLVRALERRLPNFKIGAAGYTSIDVTRKGIDKAYGIRQIKKHLRVSISQMIFIGDALFPGGNDFAARRTGVKCIAVAGPAQTKRLVRSWINALP